MKETILSRKVRFAAFLENVKGMCLVHKYLVPILYISIEQRD
jgi:hypothetical protein